MARRSVNQLRQGIEHGLHARDRRGRRRSRRRPCPRPANRSRRRGSSARAPLIVAIASAAAAGTAVGSAGDVLREQRGRLQLRPEVEPVVARRAVRAERHVDAARSSSPTGHAPLASLRFERGQWTTLAPAFASASISASSSWVTCTPIRLASRGPSASESRETATPEARDRCRRSRPRSRAAACGPALRARLRAGECERALRRSRRSAHGANAVRRAGRP